MSLNNYNTTRNKELKFWNKIPNPPATQYNKAEMLKKLAVLHKHKPKAAIWTSLTVQLQLGKALTYKQQTVIDTAYEELQKKRVKVPFSQKL